MDIRGNDRAFEGLQDEVVSMRATIAPEMLRQSQARHPGSGMKAKQWEEFLLDYKGPVDKSLADYVRWVGRKIVELEGSPPPAKSEDSPHIGDEEDLEGGQAYHP